MTSWLGINETALMQIVMLAFGFSVVTVLYHISNAIHVVHKTMLRTELLLDKIEGHLMLQNTQLPDSLERFRK